MLQSQLLSTLPSMMLFVLLLLLVVAPVPVRSLDLRVGPAAVGGGDFAAWDRSLRTHVRPGSQFGVPLNVVDYHGLAQNANFAAFLTSLARANLAGLTRNESFALGINAYNAFAIDTLIKFACKHEDNSARSGACLGPAYGLPDITFANGSSTAFTAKLHTFGGMLYSLDDIEGMMRPTPSAPLFTAAADPTEDLRVHACLVCDGTSCPDLAATAYTAQGIDAEMDASVASWMGNPWKGMRIDTVAGVVHLTKIANWFEKEFAAQGGLVTAYWGHLTAEARAFFSSGVKYSTEYFPYLWDANGPVPCSCRPPVTTASLLLPGCHAK